MGSLNDIKKQVPVRPPVASTERVFNFTLKNIRQGRYSRLGYATARSRQVTRCVV